MQCATLLEDQCMQTSRPLREGSYPLSRAQREASTQVKGRDVQATLIRRKEGLVQWEGSAEAAFWQSNETPTLCPLWEGMAAALCAPSLFSWYHWSLCCEWRPRALLKLLTKKFTRPDPARKQGMVSVGHLKRKTHSSFMMIMEIIIHNQCPLTLSAGLWINSVLAAEERPLVLISGYDQNNSRGRGDGRGWCNWAQALDIFAQPAQGNPSLHFLNMYLAACFQAASFQSLCPAKLQRVHSPCRELPQLKMPSIA